MIDTIKKFKKVELHLHLDGSVSISTLSRISGLSEEKLKKDMIAKNKCENLSEYLTKFDLPLKYMQTEDNLKIIAQDLVNYLESQNVIYAEVRFAPQFHTKDGLSYEEVVEAVLEGLNSNKNVKINLILCMMRGLPRENNLRTIDVVEKYLNKGVCALDLAGAEDKYPINEYLELFEIAKDKNIPFTIHAGENGDYTEIKKAIMAGASRIGHGIHAIDSLETQNLIKEKDILLEICPTSNIQTNSVDIYKNHPINSFYKDGLKICINTDNKTVSNISLNEEYIKLYHTFNFSLDDFKNMNKYAIDKAFLTMEEKCLLLENYK